MGYGDDLDQILIHIPSSLMLLVRPGTQGNRPFSLCLGCVNNTRPPEGLYENLARIVAMAQLRASHA